jgi:serine/threonine protein phosphatase PrpC
MSAKDLVVVAEGRSLRGASHQDNEDAWQIYSGEDSEPGVLAVIADGVSSVAGGRLASTLACERLSQFLALEEEAELERLVQLVAEIDWELRGQDEVSACTLSVLWLNGATASIVAVGDSPVFLLRQQELSRVVGQASRGFLKTFMGMGVEVVDRVEVAIEAVQPGDVFILATDGVSEFLGEGMVRTLWEGNPGAGACADAIIEAVDSRKGEDDATVVVVQAIAPGQEPGGPQDVPEPPPHLRRS